MENLGVCLLAQLTLMFGMAGLFWPEKFMTLFEVLMFPWAASYRIVRAHALASVGVSLLLVATLVYGRS